MTKHIINNPGGRKPLPDDQKYGKAIAVRYTPKQMIRIRRKAGALPISTYIREASLHATVRQPVTRELMKEIRALNNLGTNVNMLARSAQKAGLVGLRIQVEKALAGINSVLRQARLKISEKEEGDASLLQ